MLQSLNIDNYLSGRQVLLKTDSQVVFFIIKKAGSHVGSLHNLFKSVWWYCLAHDISIEANWIPREENEFADWYSKLIDSSDVQLNCQVFEMLAKIWGGFSIDLFASYNNYQMKPYFSLYWTPDTSGVNAYNYEWLSGAWCNPPFNQISKVISHARFYGVEQMCLIVPLWTQATWWNKLIQDRRYFQPFVHACYVLPYQGLFSNCEKRQPKYVGWDTLALRLDFSRLATSPTRVPFSGPGSILRLTEV